MATATKKVPAHDPSADRGPRAPASRASLTDHVLHGIDAIYRFLASLKLAVLGLSSLAASLAFATWLESRYGTTTAQDFVYRSTWFAALLGFLAINILCAALIRFPWKKRQTGFVITHAGLLVLILGSYLSFRTADEGLVAMLEGDSKAEMQRRQDSVIRVRELDGQSGSPGTAYDMHFRPGPFPWGDGQAHVSNLFDLGLSSLSDGRLPIASSTGELLSQPGDPFKLVVKQHLPASTPAMLHEADPAGVPMARLQLEFKAPGMPQAREVFADEEAQWFKLDRRFYRLARNQMGGGEAPAMMAFAYVDRPEYVEDFLNPPMTAGPRGVARFRYLDRSGKTRAFDLPLEGQEGKTLTLPESDLEVKVEKVADFPTSEGGLFRILGEAAIPVGMFQIRKGTGAPVEHFAMGGLPMVPNVMPNPKEPDAKPPQPLAAIHLMILPDLDPKTSGRMGQIDVLAGPDGGLSYRVFGRGKEGKTVLRSSGQVEKAKSIPALGGGDSPMFINFRVDDYLPAGIEKQIFKPVYLPKAQMEEGVPASLLEMTVGDVTREIWIQRSESPEAAAFKPVAFGDRMFEIAYDVDRRPLGFELKLDKFEVNFDPGTETPTRFVSEVRLTDSPSGIKDQPHTISMNEPLSHRGYTFYQMRYSALQDPRTGQRTGQFQSVLQVGTDPGRPIKYAGCILLVAGIFAQFYMRAGVFTDGGKRERERAARKLGSDSTTSPEPAAVAIEEERL